MLGQAPDSSLILRLMRDPRDWFHVTLASIGDAVIVTDMMSAVTFMNPVAEGLTGWTLQEACGRPLEQVFQIIHENTRQRVEHPVARVLREGVRVELPTQSVLLARDGAEKPIDDSAAPIRDSEGNMVGAVLVFRDATERRRAEQARFHLAAIVESSEDAIVGKTLDGKIVSWNAGAERLYGYSADEIKGQPVSVLVPPGRTDEVPRVLAKLRRGERIETYETVRLRKDGVLVDVSVSISPIKNDAGQIVGASAVARDITGRKRVDSEIQRLHKSLEHRVAELQTLLDVVPIAIAMAEDPECRCVKVNRYFAGLLSIPPGTDSFLGLPGPERPPYKLMRDGKEVPHQELPLQYAAAKGVDVSDAEIDIIREDGKIINLFGYAAPLFDEQGVVRGALGAFLDITDRKRTEEQVKAALREKEVLLREVHHRVKNNLQIITSLLNLQAGFIQDEQARQVYKDSQNRVRSMALLHAVLYQSKSLAEIDFAQYLRRLTVDLLHSYGAPSRGIRLNINVDPLQFGIETALPCGLVVNELVSNALKHAFPDGRTGEIRIDLHRNPDSTYTLTVRDDGVGFPPNLDFQNTESLGLQLVSTLTCQLEAHLELHRDGGTSFELTFSELKYKERL